MAKASNVSQALAKCHKKVIQCLSEAGDNPVKQQKCVVMALKCSVRQADVLANQILRANEGDNAAAQIQSGSGASKSARG